MKWHSEAKLRWRGNAIRQTQLLRGRESYPQAIGEPHWDPKFPRTLEPNAAEFSVVNHLSDPLFFLCCFVRLKTDRDTVVQNRSSKVSISSALFFPAENSSQTSAFCPVVRSSQRSSVGLPTAVVTRSWPPDLWGHPSHPWPLWLFVAKEKHWERHPIKMRYQGGYHDDKLISKPDIFYTTLPSKEHKGGPQKSVCRLLDKWICLELFVLETKALRVKKIGQFCFKCTWYDL